MSNPREQLSDAEQRLLWRALSHPVGRYSAERASHLSGIPERTVYDWAGAGVVVPDFVSLRPKKWSYRDVVLLRFAGWLRSKGTNRDLVSERVDLLRATFESEDQAFVTVMSDGTHMFFGAEGTDRRTKQMTLGDIADRFLDVFTLMVPEAISDFGRRADLWGPDLLQPTEHTRLYPWVLGGEPCIAETRLATSAVFALNRDRLLDPVAIAALYPGVNQTAVEEGIRLEQSVRQHRNLLAA